MIVEFAIDRWSAWAPGLTDTTAWQSWFAQPHPLPTEGTPALTEVPAMMRRRVERLGRIALQAAYGCQADAAETPVVFASRYGDLTRSVELLTQLAKSEPLSPASFSLSVHNAIGALYSIIRGHTGAYSAVASGPETVEAAVVEACGLLADGAESVLVVAYDEPVPSPWQHFAESADFPRAFACRLRAASRVSRFTLSCQVGSDDGQPRTNALPPDLAVLRFLVSGAEQFEHPVGHRRWRWQRHA